MPLPERPQGARVGMVVSPSVLKVYCNRTGMTWLSEVLCHLAKSPEKAYRELHLEPTARLEPDEKPELANHDVFMLVEEALSTAIVSPQEPLGFHVNFMTVEDQDISGMEKYLFGGTVPNGWTEGEED